MLDNFEIGGPISDHDGVRCCPAMRKNSDDKYIVKIISVPASQTKLDALLLTGAYPDKTSALTYFHEVANGIIDEKKVLDNLANLEGFVSFKDCQIVPMEDGSGFDVYLLSDYKMRFNADNSFYDAEYLSFGTYEQIYLALRLATAELICEELPVFLDDILTSYDDERTKNAIECLGDLDERQIVLFTCHKSDAEFAEKTRAYTFNI
jgi:hypothetical protein